MKKKPATSLIAGSLVVTLYRTTLADVLRYFPGGNISLDREQGASSTYSLCYTIRSVKPTEYIWFISDGEMGGYAHHITEIQATRRVLSRVERSQCGDITKRLKFAFNNGIWIGSTIRQVDKVLGTPSAKKGHWYGYSYEGKEQSKLHGGLVSFDVGNFFQVHIKNGAVIEIDASEVISN